MLLLAFLSVNKKQVWGNGQVGLNALEGENLWPPSAYLFPVPAYCANALLRQNAQMLQNTKVVHKHSDSAKHQDDS